MTYLNGETYYGKKYTKIILVYLKLFNNIIYKIEYFNFI